MYFQILLVKIKSKSAIKPSFHPNVTLNQIDKILCLSELNCNMRLVFLNCINKIVNPFGIALSSLKIGFKITKIFILVVGRIFGCNRKHFINHVESNIPNDALCKVQLF